MTDKRTYTVNDVKYEIIGTNPDILMIDEVGEVISLEKRLLGITTLGLEPTEESAERVNVYFDTLRKHQREAIAKTFRELNKVMAPKHGPRGKWGKLKSR